MNDLIRPALYGSYQGIRTVAPARAGEPVAADVVGPVCESGDFFAKDRRCRRSRPGDLLAVMSAGAYGFVMASNYNARPRPPRPGRRRHASTSSASARRSIRRDFVRGERHRPANRARNMAPPAFHQDARHRQRLRLRRLLRRVRRRPCRAGAARQPAAHRHRLRWRHPDLPVRHRRLPHGDVQRRRQPREMCGNGIRCVGKYVYDHGLVRRRRCASTPMRA